MELRGGRGGGRGERRPPAHGFGWGAARGAEGRGSAARLARGVTVGAGRVTLERRRVGDGEPRGRHAGEAARRPRRGEGRGPDRPRRGRGSWAVQDRAPRGHVRWGRGLFGERASGGVAAGGGRGGGVALTWRSLRGGGGRAPEVPPREAALRVRDRVAERGPGPHGGVGTPPPRSRPPEAPGGRMVGGSRLSPARGELFLGVI